MIWMYIAEVGNDLALGISSMVLMLLLTIQSFAVPSIIGSKKSDIEHNVPYLFYFLAIFQLITCTILALWMKETKGLSLEQKSNLYK